MKVLVCGGRDFGAEKLDKPRSLMMAERHFARDVLDALHAASPFSLVIHGAARGADTCGGEWAKLRGVPVAAYPADWRAHGRGAGPIRNRLMLKRGAPDLVVAFPGGNGTAHMVRIARAAGVEVREIGFDPCA